MHAGGDPVGDEVNAGMRDDLPFKVDRGSRDVGDERLGAGDRPFDLERAVAADPGDRLGQAVRRVGRKDDDAAEAAVPGLEARASGDVGSRQDELASGAEVQRSSQSMCFDPKGSRRPARSEAVGRVDADAGSERQSDRE